MNDLFPVKKKIIDSMDDFEKEYFSYLLTKFYYYGVFTYLEKLDDIEWKNRYKGFRYEYAPIKAIIRFFYQEEISDKNSFFYLDSNLYNELRKRNLYNAEVIRVARSLSINILQGWLFFKSDKKISGELNIPIKTVEMIMRMIKKPLQLDYLMIPTKAMNNRIYMNNKNSEYLRVVTTHSFSLFVDNLECLMIKNQIANGSPYLEEQNTQFKYKEDYIIWNRIIFAFKESGIIDVNQYSKDVLPFIKFSERKKGMGVLTSHSPIKKER